ncbi:hypothetical protein M2132_001592 [Dysgonomonas sp. PH5-45]|uniref:DUF6029 family protein n=1 Tax=unclassified Dysgonomonas TaxID=2630389 RepID=UPI0024746959|nr:MULTISPECIES: DUF6029 family protein [unclassified Dysgonomonas]MDH6355254.1 hypothetical protein [Dysgonomonas sp. PH5-45]MDH6388124.1 hypothetical protein [Dysgonomonas sp. PH5-37]
MKKNYLKLGSLLLLGLLSANRASAQEGNDSFWKDFKINGSLQSEIMLFPEKDKKIGAEGSDDWWLTNTYFNLNLNSKHIEAGARLEFMEHPLIGFDEKDFEGWGVPNIYVTAKFDKIQITAGDFYDQFGSGLIFRTYEERSLGIDNSLRGGRIAAQPFKGVRLKVLGGKQRYYFDHHKTFIWGADAEFSIDQWSKKLAESNTYLTFGASYVGKHRGDEFIEAGVNPDDPTIHYKLNLPENVGAFDFRAKLQKGNYSFLAEYAIKNNDPTFRSVYKENNLNHPYIYRKGQALLLAGSYSKKGMSVLLQAKRSDNMSFMSTRQAPGGNPSTLSSTINHLPAFVQQQTYALATLYPYSTQPEGEWAFQGELSYTFKRNTPLGGKYGTRVKLGGSHIRSIEMDPVEQKYGTWMGTKGYNSSFFKMGGKIYYQDLIFGVEKKMSAPLLMNFTYMHQYFNHLAVYGKPTTLDKAEIVKTHIFILEGKYKINNKNTLRGELQYLTTKQDYGDWIAGVLEYSLLPYLMFSVSDTYNVGETDIHYYMGSVTGTYKSHRLMVSYGRTREGYNCSGGVCRIVPAYKGLQLSYSYNF